MTRYRFERCTLDTARREVTCGGEVTKISARAFAALEALLSAYPNAIARDDLYRSLWPDTYVNLTNLNNVIAELRSAIGDTKKRIVVTKHRFGYMIGVTVAQEERRHLRSKCRLVIAGTTVMLGDGDNLVGRASDAVVSLDHPSISRRHAIIRIEHERAVVEDLRSKNGTFVDGDRVQGACDLRDGATVRFGSIYGLFRATPLGATTATDPFIG